MDDDTADLLLTLARAGFGTVLGGRRRGAGLHRVGRARAGERVDALDRLYRDQFTSLVAYAARRLPDRASAEDVVQRAFEKVWRRSPELDDLDNPAAYVATATRNEINRELRRVVVERARTATSATEEEAAATDVSAQIGERLALTSALAALPAREREAVVLRLQWELTVVEAAAVMGLSTGAVKSYTHHGVRKLRDHIGVA